MLSLLSYVRRHHLALVALFVALSAGAYAAVSIPPNSVGTKQLKKNAVNTKKVKDKSLLAKDFKAGQLPAGATGPQGPKGDTGAPGLPGAKGDTGATGTVDTSNFFNKTESDGRYARGPNTQIAISQTIQSDGGPALDNAFVIPGLGEIDIGACTPGLVTSVAWHNTGAGAQDVNAAVKGGNGALVQIASGASTASLTDLAGADIAQLFVSDVTNPRRYATVWISESTVGPECRTLFTAIYTL